MMTNQTDYQLPPQTDDDLTVSADQKDFALCPAGQHPARCVDVVFRGLFPNKFKEGAMQPKISIHLMLDAQDEDGNEVRRGDGKRFVLSQWYTKSMNDKANLRKTLESWRGKAFDDAVAERFNLNDLINAPALVNVKHVRNAKGDEVAVIDTLTKLPRQMSVFPVEEIEWVRLKDRPREPQKPANGSNANVAPFGYVPPNLPPPPDEWQGDDGYDNEPLPF